MESGHEIFGRFTAGLHLLLHLLEQRVQFHIDFKQRACFYNRSHDSLLMNCSKLSSAKLGRGFLPYPERSRSLVCQCVGPGLMAMAIVSPEPGPANAKP